MSHKEMKLFSESEFAIRLLTIVQSRVKEMNDKDKGEVIGLRLVIKGNPLSDGSGRYTISIDGGTVYKFLIDPNIK